MSRQSKNARKAAVAKQFKGSKGPAKTSPKHGKRNAWWQKGSSNNRTRSESSSVSTGN